MRGLENKRVLITGGASGIGKATVKRFLEENSQVVVFDLDREACAQIKQEMPQIKGVVPADVSNPESVLQAFAKLDNLLGGVDILINNAGISIRHDQFTEISPQDWKKVLGVNLDGVFYVGQQAAKRMQSQGSGVIINMGSTNGLTGYKYYFDYNASKAGVIELTRSMALELAPEIRVLAVCPGYVLTPMQEAEYTQEMMDELNNKLPLRRHAKPEEVAALFAFLASEEAPYITGHPIIIDGGETAGGLASR